MGGGQSLSKACEAFERRCLVSVPETLELMFISRMFIIGLLTVFYCKTIEYFNKAGRKSASQSGH